VEGDTAVAVQAIAAAVSAATALGLGWFTYLQGRDIRAARDRELEREQLQAIVRAVGRLQALFDDEDGLRGGYELARTELAAALALRPVELPACRALLGDEMPAPPYGFDHTPYEHLHRAYDELKYLAESRPATSA
jgi:hypothetical protein